MKYKKNIIAFIFLCSITNLHELSAVLTVSQYKPESFFQKPYFDQNYFTKISCIFSGGFAEQAYTNDGTKVPYLQQFGSENLLKKFIDVSLPTNNLESFGQGKLTGQFHVREIIISAYKNMTHGFFIEAATAIQDLMVNKISIDYVEKQDNLNQEQIDYLHILQQKIPVSINRSGMFTSAFYAGYTKTYSEFNHLDFIDFTIKAGFTSPQAMSDNNNSIVQLPFNENMNFGYPMIAVASFGFLDWLTVGSNCSITPWQNATKIVPLNNNVSGNNLLVSQSGLATIGRYPLLTASVYVEFDHIYQGFSGTLAYCYTKNFAYTITPIDQTQFSKNIVNQSPLFNAWSLGSLYIQFDIDWACQSKPSAPVITIFCNIPVAGQLCPKTNIFAGSCSVQLSYIF